MVPRTHKIESKNLEKLRLVIPSRNKKVNSDGEE